MAWLRGAHLGDLGLSCAAGTPPPGDPVAMVLGLPFRRLWRSLVYTAARAPPRANPRHLWVESLVESNLCNSPLWAFVDCGIGRRSERGEVGTFSRCRPGADPRGDWLVTLACCWLTSPCTFPAAPRSSHRHHQKRFRDW